MESSQASPDDRTLVVISGPYDHYVEPVLADLSKAVSLIEHRLSALEAAGGSEFVAGIEGGSNDLADLLKAHIGEKADSAQVVDLQNRVEKLSLALQEKANGAELQGIRRHLHRLDASSKANDMSVLTTQKFSNGSLMREGSRTEGRGWPRLLMLLVLGLVVGLLGGFFGAQLQSARIKTVGESWAVKTSGNQILITRVNSSGSSSSVTVNSAQPLKASGEQTFSSFADVKQYIDTITSVQPAGPTNQSNPLARGADVASQPPASEPSPSEIRPAEVVAAIAFREGDSLKKLAQRYNVPRSRLIALNPDISRWSLIKVGQKIVVPAGSLNNRTVAEPSAAHRSTVGPTMPVMVEAGDTLDKLATRHNLPPSKLRELNPGISNWSKIQAGQKVLVPAQVRG